MLNKSFRKGLVYAIVVLFVGASVVSGIEIQMKDTAKSSRGDILYVGGSEPGNYSKIQDAIDNASDGDTVFVYNGTYYENVNINKQLTIRSVSGDPSDTIVNASDPNDDVFEVSADYVNISGFSIENATGAGKVGIYLSNGVEYCNISNNNASNNVVGIELSSTSNNNHITGNNISSNNDYGISLKYSNNNNITGNNASNNDYGIYLLWVSNNNHITGNNANSNNDYGIRLDSSSNNNHITGNNATNNDYGIYLVSSHNNHITGNNASNNVVGIELSSTSNNNHIIGNNADSNNIYGIYLVSSHNNHITGNNASNNDCGIDLYSSSNNNITGNNANSNNNRGIYLYYSSNNNTVTGNNASNNDLGIYLYFSSNNNHIFNNLFYNTNNAHDDGNNIWNITKKLGKNIIGGPYLGGNYFSDYSGVDIDGDGIGDTPYNISGGNNKDYLPLMYWENHPPDTPIIDGPNSGKPGVEYTYCINASDPDNDSLYVLWNWDDGTSSGWLGPYVSGTEVCDSHTWNETGTYTISATVRDEYGESVTVYKEVTMPRNKAINTPFLNFLQSHPNLFLLLQRLLQRLGLQ